MEAAALGDNMSQSHLQDVGASIRAHCSNKINKMSVTHRQACLINGEVHSGPPVPRGAERKRKKATGGRAAQYDLSVQLAK